MFSILSHQTLAVIKREARTKAHIHTNVGVVTIIVDGNVVHLHCGEQERGGELKARVWGDFFFRCGCGCVCGNTNRGNKAVRER